MYVIYVCYMVMYMCMLYGYVVIVVVIKLIIVIVVVIMIVIIIIIVMNIISNNNNEPQFTYIYSLIIFIINKPFLLEMFSDMIY